MKGIMVNLEKLQIDVPRDIGFRAITDYIPQTDGTITRLDIKSGENRYNVAFGSTMIEPDTKGEMATPRKSVLECVNVKTSKLELIRALKELISDLENE